MKIHRYSTPLCLALAHVLPISVAAQDTYQDPYSFAAIKSFLADGFGAGHAEAPPETEQFARLVGIWDTQQEMITGDGSWKAEAPGLWVWKYALDGFAVQDLWFQSEQGLPSYMANLGRDYLLTASRIYDVRSGQWKVAWMANGAGKMPGQDFGTFDAEFAGGSIVMSGPPVPNFGLQRVVFASFTENSFEWRSEFSQDEGKTWITGMRVRATRRRTR